LKEAVPKLSRVAFLIDPTGRPFNEGAIKAHRAAAEALGIALWPAEVMTLDDLDPVFSKIVEDRADGFVVGNASLLFALRARLGALAVAHKLPAMAPAEEFLPPGLLMSYGQDLPDFFRRAAGYMDKILKGTKRLISPSSSRPNSKLAINLKVARALEISIPQTLSISADDLIE